MVWLKLEDTFHDSPKIRRAARILGIPPEYAEAYVHGTLARLWTWALRHAADGNLSGKHVDDIEIAVGWYGDNGAWVDAMINVGLLDDDDGELKIHNAKKYGGSKARSEQKRIEREAKKALAKDSAHLAPDVARQSRDVAESRTTVAKCRSKEEIRGEEREKREEESLLFGSAAPTETALAKVKPKAERIEGVEAVVAYYRERHPTRGKQLKPGHRDYKLIRARLEEGFSVDDLKRAVDGNMIDDWHQANGKHSVEFVFRNTTKVEDFISTAQTGPKRGTLGDKQSRSIAAAQRWLASQKEQRGNGND